MEEEQKTRYAYPVFIPKFRGVTSPFTEADVLEHFRTHMEVLKPELGRHCLLQVFDSNIRNQLRELLLQRNQYQQKELCPFGMNQQTWNLFRCDKKLFDDYCEIVLQPTIEQGYGTFILSVTTSLLDVNNRDADPLKYDRIQAYCGLLGGEQFGLAARKMLINLNKVFNYVWMICSYGSQLIAGPAGGNIQIRTLEQISSVLVESFTVNMSELIKKSLAEANGFRIETTEVVNLVGAEILTIACAYCLGPVAALVTTGVATLFNLKTKVKLYANAFSMGVCKPKNIHEKVAEIAQESNKWLPILTKTVLDPLVKVLEQILCELLQGNWTNRKGRFEQFLITLESKESLHKALDILAPMVRRQKPLAEDPDFLDIIEERDFGTGELDSDRVVTNPISRVKSSVLHYNHTL